MNKEFPVMEDRVYSYKELKKIYNDFCITDVINCAFLQIGLSVYETDINYLSAGRHKIDFYSTTLNWSNLTLLVNNEPVTSAQREHYNMENTAGLKYSKVDPTLAIPENPRQWTKELSFFLSRHEN
ncbi:MAG TPA: hypothetical protein VK484_02790 [Ferruginibacter sp.]|nr:hypothetical protein [Ferruginibacter sp.]